MLFFIFFSLLGIYLSKDFLPESFFKISLIGILSLFSLSIFGVIVCKNKKLLSFFLKILTKVWVLKKYRKKVRVFIEKFQKGIHSINVNLLVKIVLLTFFIWIIESLLLFLSSLSLGISLDFWICLGFCFLSNLVGLVTLPGGLGSTEATLTFLLSLLNIPIPLATSITFLYRIISYLIQNLIGAFSIVFFFEGSILKKVTTFSS